MRYTSYEDLADTIRLNLWKIPSDVGTVVGIPRSGVIPALMIAELLNIRSATLDEWLSGRAMSEGSRGRMMRTEGRTRVMVIDDTVYSGQAIREARWRLSEAGADRGVLFASVYVESPEARQMVDLFLEDIASEGERMFLKEWNILHLYKRHTAVSMWDIDGVICKDPPDEELLPEAYRAYLPAAVAMAVPETPVGAIVTYRLECFREVTERWLAAHGVAYRELRMFPGDRRSPLRRRDEPARFKAVCYRQAAWAELFVESDPRQAPLIASLSGKPVWCYGDGRMYCP